MERGSGREGRACGVPSSTFHGIKKGPPVDGHFFLMIPQWMGHRVLSLTLSLSLPFPSFSLIIQSCGIQQGAPKYAIESLVKLEGTQTKKLICMDKCGYLALLYTFF